jgi:Uncharacterized stress protein (general stress protein 26)
MELREVYEKMMTNITNIALATSVDGVPNVRIICFGYESSTPNKLYFTTYPGKPKVEEFAKNSKVSFILLPEAKEYAEVRGLGTVKPTEKPLEEIGGLIAKKFPPFEQMLASAKDIMLAYEIEFSEVKITEGLTEPKTLVL